jgi:hypothetical protein
MRLKEFLLQEDAFKTLPKGWTKDSLAKFAKTLTKKGKGEEGFFRACVAKMKDTDITDPDRFCGALKARYFKEEKEEDCGGCL